MFKISKKKIKQNFDKNTKEKLKRYFTFLGRKTQYCQDVSSPQLDLQTATKIPVGYFIDINKPILKFIWRGKIPE